MFDAWAYGCEIDLEGSQPGKSVPCAFFQSFNGSMRDDCLNTNWYDDYEQARILIEKWKNTPNDGEASGKELLTGMLESGATAFIRSYPHQSNPNETHASLCAAVGEGLVNPAKRGCTFCALAVYRALTPRRACPPHVPSVYMDSWATGGINC